MIDAGNGPEPDGVVALRLLRWAEKSRSSTIFVARSDTRAGRLFAAIRGFAPQIAVLHLPPWDSLPYERVSPSAEAMGRRMAVLNRMVERSEKDEPDGCPLILLTSVEAAGQRLPPRGALSNSSYRLRAGGAFDVAASEDYLTRTGYAVVDQVESPGEAALRGEVVDIYSPGAEYPSRLSYSDGRIAGIRRYDPVSQRTIADADELVLDPASEILLEPGQPRLAGIEQLLPRFYPHLDSIFEYLPQAAMGTDPEMQERLASWAELIADAWQHRRILRRTGAAETPIPPDQLYLTADEWQELLHSRQHADLDAANAEAGPSFAGEADPVAAARHYLRQRHSAGDRIVLASRTAAQLHRLARAAPEQPTNVNSWSEGEAAAIAALLVPLDAGFRFDGATVLAAADLWGPEAAQASSHSRILPETDLSVGDIVIHQEHGIGRLEGIETVAADELPQDFLRLAYAGPTAILAPIDEIDCVRRYGSADTQVALDRPDGERWRQRRAEIEAELASAAQGLVALANERRCRRAAVLDPPRRAYDRFAGRFPYPETPDQTRAIAAVLSDLRSGRPMDRLVCGEVGFGKTEVALRAAAAAVLCGQQTAVLAPTTVLARQHFETFRNRFAPLGIEIVQLSRLVSVAEAKSAKQKLRSGAARIAVGTHALLSKSVRFKELGLLVVDEEQRFGVRHKAAMRLLGRDIHVLTMTATPIPRTLELGLVGIAEISVIATPPARRQPVRTVVQAFDPVAVREALLWENRRGGQSFVVTPRIEDIEGLANRLAELAPELDIEAAHARLPPVELDNIMVEFADGQGDVLLSTSIIESGLDLPAANTMVVCRPDRFGLAQLHQLRGRVGRGRARASCYLLFDPDAPPSRAAEKRLKTLAALDRPGAGIEISTRDLDLRGAGDILGPGRPGISS